MQVTVVAKATETTVDDTALEVIPTTIDVTVGDQAKIITNKDKVYYELISGGDSIVAVSSDGTVTGIRAGSTCVIVSDDAGNSVKVDITVHSVTTTTRATTTTIRTTTTATDPTEAPETEVTESSTTIKLTESELSVYPTEKEISIGDSFTIRTTLSGCKFSIDNPFVAVVSTDGKVTGLSSGNAIITVTSPQNQKAYVKLTVLADETEATTEATEAPVFSVTPSYFILNVGETSSTPITATGNVEIKYFSSVNSDIADVDDDGYVTALSYGSTEILVVGENGSVNRIKVYVLSSSSENESTVSATTTTKPIVTTTTTKPTTTIVTKKTTTTTEIYETEYVEESSLSESETESAYVTIGSIPSFEVYTEDLMLSVGESFTIETSTNNLTFTSLDESICTVDNNGKVTAISAGDADIEISNGYMMCTLTVTVISTEETTKELVTEELSLTVGEQKQIDLDYTNYSFSTTDKSVVTVTRKGLITAISVGKADIVIKDNTGADFAIVFVDVTEALPALSATVSKEVLYVGDTVKINTNRTDVNYLSTNTSVAKVDSDGTIHALTSGTTKITVYTAAMEFVTINIQVKDKPVTTTVATTKKTTTTTTTSKSSNKNLGDVNKDGTVNSIDAVNVLVYYASTLVGKSKSIDKTIADVNSDGKVNSIDATFILKYYASKLVNSKISDMATYMKTHK
jgi:uncharacterized protein YjdB